MHIRCEVFSPQNIQLQRPWYRTRVTRAMRADIWLDLLHVFNGLTPMVEARRAPAHPYTLNGVHMGL